MFVPASHDMAFGLVILAMICWGSWAFLRTFCTSKAPVFCQLYFFGQFASALIFCFTIGEITSSDSHNPNFDNTSFSSVMTNPGSPSKIFAIFLGGHLNGNADFLCALACGTLPFGVAFPVYAGWGLAQGTLLNCLVLGLPDKPIFLFLGVFFALFAIAQLAYSDSYDKKPDAHAEAETLLLVKHQKEQGSRVSWDSSEDINDAIPNRSTATANKKDEYNGGYYHYKGDGIRSEPSSSPHTEHELSAEESRKWIFLCIFAGVLSGLWSPLSSYGAVGEGGVHNDFASLFIFQFGQFSAIPMFLNYYGMGYVYAPHYIRKLMYISSSDAFYGLAAGITGGIGYALYFLASSVISPSISFSIGACCPLFTILLGVVFAKQLVGASIGKTMLLVGAIVCYVAAITLIANSKK